MRRAPSKRGSISSTGDETEAGAAATQPPSAITSSAARWPSCAGPREKAASMRRSVHEVDAGAEADDIVVAQDAVQRAVAATGDARTEPEKYRGLPAKAARSDRPERLGACKLRRRNDERRLVTVLGIPLLSATVTCGAAVADRNSPLCVFARSRACAAAPPARSRPPCPQPALAPPPDRTARRAPLRCVSRAHRASPGSARTEWPAASTFTSSRCPTNPVTPTIASFIGSQEYVRGGPRTIR